jgi:hypothetical protein
LNELRALAFASFEMWQNRACLVRITVAARGRRSQIFSGIIFSFDEPRNLMILCTGRNRFERVAIPTHSFSVTMRRVEASRDDVRLVVDELDRFGRLRLN